MPLQRVFLLSPARCGGRRATTILRESGASELARRIRAGEAAIGDAFSTFSGLYFRGKLAYAQRFGGQLEGVAPVHVITPTRGLLPPEHRISSEIVVEFAAVDVAADNAAYRAPLERDVCALAGALPADAEVVLLGSIATGKYVDILLEHFGARLLFPIDFVGRGDMSRGALMLRAAHEGVELAYAPVAGSVRTGPRAPGIAAR
jgi:hypothetical protein